MNIRLRVFRELFPINNHMIRLYTVIPDWIYHIKMKYREVKT